MQHLRIAAKTVSKKIRTKPLAILKGYAECSLLEIILNIYVMYILIHAVCKIFLFILFTNDSMSSKLTNSTDQHIFVFIDKHCVSIKLDL